MVGNVECVDKVRKGGESLRAMSSWREGELKRTFWWGSGE